MNLRLKGKKVFITGSTSGIGLEIAKKFHSYGSIIALNSRNKESLENAKKHFSDPVEAIQGDMTSEESAKEAINKFVDKFSSLDILICNVGSGRSVTPLMENISDWEKSISLNLFSAINPISVSIKEETNIDKLIEQKKIFVLMLYPLGTSYLEVRYGKKI